MRGSTARALLSALAVLALVALVAIAATGTTPSGTGTARPPADILLDTFLSLGMVLTIPALAIFVWALFQREAIAREVASGRYRRMSLVTFLAMMGAYGALAYYAILRRPQAAPDEEVGDAFPGTQPRDTIDPSEPTRYEPEFALVPVLVMLAVVAVGIGAAYVSLRRRAQSAEEERALSAQLAGVLSDTLDDLRAEADPRRAVIAAYARFERVLASHGLPRHAAETPDEYLARILGDLDVDERSVRRLTDLFEEAKFSDHDVSRTMKDEAIEALQEVRDELHSPRETAPSRDPVPVGSS